MIKKNEPWKWDTEKKALFEKVKQEFTKEPILRIYHPDLPMKVKTDTSDFALKACLLQKHDEV